MIFWMRKFNKKLTENNLKTLLNIVYVDDQNWAGRVLKKGTRWDPEKGKMRCEKDWEKED